MYLQKYYEVPPTVGKMRDMYDMNAKVMLTKGYIGVPVREQAYGLTLAGEPTNNVVHSRTNATRVRCGWSKALSIE
jgi:hypothetical protein